MRIWGMWCPAAFSLKRDEVLLLRNITSIMVFLESRDKLISSVIYCDKLKHIWSLRATKWVKRKKYRTSNTWWSPVFLYLLEPTAIKQIHPLCSLDIYFSILVDEVSLITACHWSHECAICEDTNKPGVNHNTMITLIYEDAFHKNTIHFP